MVCFREFEKIKVDAVDFLKAVQVYSNIVKVVNEAEEVVKRVIQVVEEFIKIVGFVIVIFIGILELQGIILKLKLQVI